VLVLFIAGFLSCLLSCVRKIVVCCSLIVRVSLFLVVLCFVCTCLRGTGHVASADKHSVSTTQQSVCCLISQFLSQLYRNYHEDQMQQCLSQSDVSSRSSFHEILDFQYGPRKTPTVQPSTKHTQTLTVIRCDELRLGGIDWKLQRFEKKLEGAQKSVRNNCFLLNMRLSFSHGCNLLRLQGRTCHVCMLFRGVNRGQDQEEYDSQAKMFIFC
jgi:hypothetical protein